MFESLKNQFQVRDYQKDDMQSVLDFIQLAYEVSGSKNTVSKGTDSENSDSELLNYFIKILENYFVEVLEKSGKISLFEDETGLIALAGFIEEDEKTAKIICFYIAPNYLNDLNLIRAFLDTIVDKIYQREYRVIKISNSAFCQEIKQVLIWERFKNDSKNDSKNELDNITISQTKNADLWIKRM